MSFVLVCWQIEIPIWISWVGRSTIVHQDWFCLHIDDHGHNFEYDHHLDLSPAVKTPNSTQVTCSSPNVALQKTVVCLHADKANLDACLAFTYNSTSRGFITLQAPAEAKNKVHATYFSWVFNHTAHLSGHQARKSANVIKNFKGNYGNIKIFWGNYGKKNSEEIMDGVGQRKVCLVTGASRGIGRGVSWINIWNQSYSHALTSSWINICSSGFNISHMLWPWHDDHWSPHQVALQLGSAGARVHVTGRNWKYVILVLVGSLGIGRWSCFWQQSKIRLGWMWQPACRVAKI